MKIYIFILMMSLTLSMQSQIIEDTCFTQEKIVKIAEHIQYQENQISQLTVLTDDLYTQTIRYQSLINADSLYMAIQSQQIDVLKNVNLNQQQNFKRYKRHTIIYGSIVIGSLILLLK